MCPIALKWPSLSLSCTWCLLACLIQLNLLDLSDRVVTCWMFWAASPSINQIPVLSAVFLTQITNIWFLPADPARSMPSGLRAHVQAKSYLTPDTYQIYRHWRATMLISELSLSTRSQKNPTTAVIYDKSNPAIMLPRSPLHHCDIHQWKKRI